MAIHRDLADSQLHEPKHIQTATAPGDAGKTIVARGDGTSELRKLTRADIPGVDAALTALEEASGGGNVALTGAYIDVAAVTGTADVTTLGKQYYFIGPVAGQNVSVQLPNPTTTSVPITVKRLTGAGTLSLIPFDVELLEGGGQLSILVENNSLTIVSDGTDWRIV